MRVWAPQKAFRHRPDAVLDQVNPGDGTYYTVLDTTPNCRIISIALVIDGTGPSDLTMRITIDGRSFECVNPFPTSGTIEHVVNLTEFDADFQLSTTYYGRYRAFLIEGQNVKVEAMARGAANTRLRCRVKHAAL